MDPTLELSLRIDWSEMDMYGHVNNVAYFKYIQAARVSFWEQVGIIKSYEQSKVGPILLSASCNFIKPLFYPGNIIISTTVEFLKNTSFGLRHRIFNEQKDLAADAQDVIVYFDFNKNEKVHIAGELRNRLATMAPSK